MNLTDEQERALVAMNEHLRQALQAFVPITALAPFGGYAVIVDGTRGELTDVYHAIRQLRHQIWRMCPKAKR